MKNLLKFLFFPLLIISINAFGYDAGYSDENYNAGIGYSGKVIYRVVIKNKGNSDKTKLGFNFSGATKVEVVGNDFLVVFENPAEQAKFSFQAFKANTDDEMIAMGDLVFKKNGDAEMPSKVRPLIDIRHEEKSKNLHTWYLTVK